MNLYVTRQFDELDAICHRFYGRTEGTVEVVMLANPGLADLMPILPQGMPIWLPVIPEPATVAMVRLWQKFPGGRSGRQDAQAAAVFPLVSGGTPAALLPDDGVDGGVP